MVWQGALRKRIADSLSSTRRRLGPLVRSKSARLVLNLLLLALAVWLIRKSLAEVSLREILTALATTPARAVGLSVLFTALSYGCLAGVEWSALKLLGKPLPMRTAAGASFSANAFSLTVGLGMASGAAVRLGIYGGEGLKAARVGKLVLVLSGSTFLSGVIGEGLATLADPKVLAGVLGWPAAGAAALGAVLLAPAALWFLVLRGRRRRRRLGPSARAAALAAGLGDWVFSGAALFVLASGAPADFPRFMAIFLLGSLITSIAGTPGGLGVLDATVLSLKAVEHTHAMAAALILYRVIYFLGPLAISAAAAAARRAAQPVRRT